MPGAVVTFTVEARCILDRRSQRTDGAVFLRAGAQRARARERGSAARFGAAGLEGADQRLEAEAPQPVVERQPRACAGGRLVLDGLLHPARERTVSTEDVQLLVALV